MPADCDGETDPDDRIRHKTNDEERQVEVAAFACKYMVILRTCRIIEFRMRPVIQIVMSKDEYKDQSGHSIFQESGDRFRYPFNTNSPSGLRSIIECNKK